jgi:hypothetical protein
MATVNSTWPAARRTGVVLVILVMLVAGIIGTGFQRTEAASHTQRILQYQVSLPTAIRSYDDIWFMEINTQFQIPLPAIVRSTEDIWFMEINTIFPRYDSLVPPAPAKDAPAGGVMPY